MRNPWFVVSFSAIPTQDDQKITHLPTWKHDADWWDESLWMSVIKSIPSHADQDTAMGCPRGPHITMTRCGRTNDFIIFYPSQCVQKCSKYTLREFRCWKNTHWWTTEMVMSQADYYLSIASEAPGKWDVHSLSVIERFCGWVNLSLSPEIVTFN